jgi:hypothetical protein
MAHFGPVEVACVPGVRVHQRRTDPAVTDPECTVLILISSAAPGIYRAKGRVSCDEIAAGGDTGTVLTEHPAHRLDPEQLVDFLDESHYQSSHCLPVDGGLSVRAS